MKKGLVGVVLMLCVCVGGATVYQKLSADRVAPQIVFEEDLTYHDGMTNEELLEGVKAEDAKDGDVSDSLVVEACSPDPAQGQAIVRYVARDARNNVARVNRVLSYDGYEKETESETEKRKESAVTKHSEKETAAETDSEKEIAFSQNDIQRCIIVENGLNPVDRSSDEMICSRDDLLLKSKGFVVIKEMGGQI